MKTNTLQNKPALIAFMLLALGTFSTALSQTSQRPEQYGDFSKQFKSTFDYLWDATKKAWVINDSSELIYNAQGQWLYRNFYEYQSGTNSWNKTAISANRFNLKSEHTVDVDSFLLYPAGNSRMVKSYNAEGQLITEIKYKYDVPNLKWIEEYQYIYTYNAGKMKATEKVNTYDLATTTWKNVKLSTYKYNQDNRLEELIIQVWDKDNLNYRNYDRELYTYATNGKMESKIEQYAGMSVWVNERKSEFDFDSENKEIQNRFYDWSYADNIWKLLAVSSFVHSQNPTKQISTTVYYNPNPAGVNHSKNEITFDDNGRPILIVQYSWDPIGNKWIGNWVYDEVYDAQGYLSKELIQKWSDIDQKFINFRNSFFRWTPAKNVSLSTEEEMMSLVVYPNPCADVCTLKIPMGETASQILIADVKGRIIQEYNGSFSGEYKLNLDYPKGIYTIQVFTGNSVYISRIVRN